MSNFHNVHDFAQAIFCIDRGEPNQVKVTERCGGRLFKHSPHGLGLMPLGIDGQRVTGTAPVWGLKVTGIVEGTDIEHVSAPLMFPFDAARFWQVCEQAGEALDDAAAEWEAQGDDAPPA